MSKYLVRGETLTAVANAIRNKTGKTNLMTLNDFVAEIEQVDHREIIETVPSITGSLTYNGSAQSPTILAYNPDQLMMTGVSSATNAGTYEIAFSPKDGYKWADNTTVAKVVEWSIAKADGSLSLSATSGTITGKGVTKTFTVTRVGDGKITAVSSSTSIATVSVSGTTVTITSKGYGSATITVSVAEGTNHKAPTSKTYSLTVSQLYIVPNTSATWTKSAGTASASKTSTSTTVSITAQSSASGTGATSSIYTQFDATLHSTLYIKGTYSCNNTTGSKQEYRIKLINSSGTTVSTIYSKDTNESTNTGNISVSKTIDISSVTGKCKIQFSAKTWSSGEAVHKMVISDCRAY